MTITNRHRPLSIREIDSNLPEDVLKVIETRFYHASREFGKMKKHLGKLEKKRQHGCPWADKIAVDAWVRKLRQKWANSPPIDSTRRGPKGWGFMPLVKIWIYAALFGLEQNAEEIANHLRKNPLYVRLCGLPSAVTFDGESLFSIPAVRTIRHFNQIMYTFDLWSDLSRLLVMHNLATGVFPFSADLVIDPTHLDAFASVNNICHDCRICPKQTHCQFKQTTCEVTGIVSKSKNFKLPGVKLNFALLPGSEIVILAQSCQGQQHDSKLLRPLLQKLADDFPQQKEQIATILADAAHDDPNSHKCAEETLHAPLVTPINPRNRKPISKPARGIDQINPYGIPICIAGHEMLLSGRDQKRQQFLWVCPVFHEQHGDSNLSCSQAKKQSCCPNACQGRVFRVAAKVTPQVNWEHPQHLIRVKKKYDQRTGVERSISRFKRILKFERFYNRGRKALQAHGDRYVIAIQLIAWVAKKIELPDAIRRCRLSG